MSKWTDQIQKDLKQFGSDATFLSAKDLPNNVSEMTLQVNPAKLLLVGEFLKRYKGSSFEFLECLTAIDYPKQFLPPPENVEPFLSASTLAQQKNTAQLRVGKSAPLDPPRLRPDETPHEVYSVEEINKVWPDNAKKDTVPDTKRPINPSSTAAKMVVKAEKKEDKKERKEEKKLVSVEKKPLLSAPVSTSASKPTTPPIQTLAKPAVPAQTAPAAPPSVPKFDLNKITIVYVLYSMDTNTRIHLRCDLNREAPEIDSVTPLWKGAEWHEREVFDLFGVKFKNHPDLRRLFMDYPEFPGGYPLRKDYQRPGFMIRLPKV